MTDFRLSKFSFLFILIVNLGVMFHLSAQPFPSAMEVIREAELRLAPMAYEVLNGDSTVQKFALNQTFGKGLMEVLSMPESYTYPFDSLTTLSRLTAPDGSFRLFSWYIVDEDQDHLYYCLVQRKYRQKNGNDTLMVIPLHNSETFERYSENRQYDNHHWYGALYYKLIALPAKGKREAFDGSGKIVKEKWTNYLLLGWNGGTIYSSYKIADVLLWDPQDSSRVVLGAPVFFFEKLPKYRVVFEYSDNAFFRLNMDKVSLRFPYKDREMLVFDHLSQPNKDNPKKMLTFGPDGSYDCLSYISRKGGFFIFLRNIRVVDLKIAERRSKDILREYDKPYKRQQRSGVLPPPPIKKPE
jgi:hypothetical protein